MSLVVEFLARAAYSALLRLATPFYLARLWWRGRSEPVYRQHWRERLALAGPPLAPGALWLHAVSLGETHAAAALVAELRARRPNLHLLLTHGTATGRAAGTALLRDGDVQVWLPYDTPGAARRFLARYRPAVGVLMETEIWPNLQNAANEAGVPMVLANARLSERSARRGKRLRWLMEPAARRLALVLAQTEGDARRLKNAGAPSISVCGNIKFDISPPTALVDRGRDWRRVLGRPVVLAASTRDGEERPLLAAWLGLPRPRPLLLLVPRHPQRFDEVAAMVRELGLNARRRSEWTDAPPVDASVADVWLGDSMGEMPLYYGLAEAALLGGSFAALGGQNLIEAAACACPLLMGPHTFNFAEASELALQAGAALRVRDMEAGVAQANALVTETSGSAQRAAMAERALSFAAQHRGAAARMAAAIDARY